jgi:hypothetical protein
MIVKKGCGNLNLIKKAIQNKTKKEVALNNEPCCVFHFKCSIDNFSLVINDGLILITKQVVILMVL